MQGIWYGNDEDYVPKNPSPITHGLTKSMRHVTHRVMTRIRVRRGDTIDYPIIIE